MGRRDSFLVVTLSWAAMGLGEAGPAENFASIPAAGKWVLTFCMLVGRLEVYTIVILFMPGFWRK